MVDVDWRKQAKTDLEIYSMVDPRKYDEGEVRTLRVDETRKWLPVSVVEDVVEVELRHASQTIEDLRGQLKEKEKLAFDRDDDYNKLIDSVEKQNKELAQKLKVALEGKYVERPSGIRKGNTTSWQEYDRKAIEEVRLLLGKGGKEK